MNNATLTASAAFLLLISTTLTAANHVFTGYFVDEQRTVAVEMEYFEGAYSGVMTDGADIFYELIARLDGTRLVGRVIAERGARAASCPIAESQSVSMDVSLQL